MINLTYSEQMKTQDSLWNEEEEDLEVMPKLYEQVMSEAITKGFNGGYVIYEGTNEAIIDIHLDKTRVDYDDADESFGYCKPLIEFLERLLNKNKEGFVIEDIKEVYNEDVLQLAEDLETAVVRSIPLKVVKLYDVKDEVYGECPDCGHSGLKKDVHQHCWWCGQKLDWNKEKIEPIVVYI